MFCLSNEFIIRVYVDTSNAPTSFDKWVKRLCFLFRLTCFHTYSIPRCSCARGFTGNRCEVSLACLNGDQCRNSGVCTTDQHGHPSCVCGRGWTGRHCEIDVDECQRQEAVEYCGGRDKCFNYDGGYACNCTGNML